MDNKIVLMVIVAIVLGMLVANMFKDVCGCKVVEGQGCITDSCISNGRDIRAGEQCEANSIKNVYTADQSYNDTNAFCHKICRARSAGGQQPNAMICETCCTDQGANPVGTDEDSQTISFNNEGCLVINQPTVSTVPTVPTAQVGETCAGISRDENGMLVISGNPCTNPTDKPGSDNKYIIFGSNRQGDQGGNDCPSARDTMPCESHCIANGNGLDLSLSPLTSYCESCCVQGSASSQGVASTPCPSPTGSSCVAATINPSAASAIYGDGSSNQVQGVCSNVHNYDCREHCTVVEDSYNSMCSTCCVQGSAISDEHSVGSQDGIPCPADGTGCTNPRKNHHPNSAGYTVTAPNGNSIISYCTGVTDEACQQNCLSPGYNVGFYGGYCSTCCVGDAGSDGGSMERHWTRSTAEYWEGGMSCDDTSVGSCQEYCSTRIDTSGDAFCNTCCVESGGSH